MAVKRKYDTTDVARSSEVAKNLGLEVVSSKDLGDQHVIIISGEEDQHGRFREHEGYAESESELVS